MLRQIVIWRHYKKYTTFTKVFTVLRRVLSAVFLSNLVVYFTLFLRIKSTRFLSFWTMSVISKEALTFAEEDNVSVLSWGSISSLPIFSDDDIVSLKSFGSISSLPIFHDGDGDNISMISFGNVIDDDLPIFQDESIPTDEHGEYKNGKCSRIFLECSLY